MPKTTLERLEEDLREYLLHILDTIPRELEVSKMIQINCEVMSNNLLSKITPVDLK